MIEESSLSTVSVISWAASQKSESQHLGARRIEGFVQDSSLNLIQLGCLKRVMQEKPFSGTGEIMHSAFEVIHSDLRWPLQSLHITSHSHH